MSVYGRKMFKRNARETLNQTAGIKNLPTQKFQAGGAVGTDNFRIGNQNYMITSGANPQVYLRTQTGAVPVNANVAAQVLARFRSPQLNTSMSLEESGIGPLKKMVDTSGAVALQQPEVAGIAEATTPKGVYEPFQYTTLPVTSAIGQALYGTSAPKTVGEKLTRMGTLGIPATFESIATSGANALLQGDAAIRETLNQMTAEREQEILSGQGTITPQEALMINAGATTLSPQLSEAILEGDIFAPGVDLLKIGASPASSGVYSKGAVSPEEEAANIQLLKNIPRGTEVRVQGKDVAAPDPMQEPSQVPYYMDKGAAPTDATTEGEAATAQAAGEEAAVTTPEDREAVREAGTYEKEYVSPKEEITRVINEGTPEEQKKTLDDFIKEFEENAPGYEGTNQGLILAKIGFAMAAGKSPRAIENIATALSDGADELIKDKAKKDEFNRQLKLSALQYGLTETSKISAEERALQRGRADVIEMVVGGDGTVYKGREYEPGESIYVSKGEIQDGLLPDNVLGTAAIDALNKRATANATALEKALEFRQITPTEYDKQLTEYGNAVTSAIQAEVGIGLLEGAMVNVAEGKVTGITPAIQDMMNRGANFFGMDLNKEYETKEDVRNAMRAALQDVIPVTLGASQSANSISNRDVDFLIEAYFGKGALNGGSLTFVTTDPDQMVKRLQRAATKMRQAQKDSFAVLTRKEAQLTPLYQPGTTLSAAALLDVDKQRLAEAGLSSSGNITNTNFGYTRGDDGVVRFIQ